MATTMVRVDENTQRRLRELVLMDGGAVRAVLAQAVARYWAERWLEGLNEEFARLRADPQAWAEELEERRAWDVTLVDGIDVE